MERSELGVLEEQPLSIGTHCHTGHRRVPAKTFRNRGKQYNGSAGELRRDRSHNPARDSAGRRHGLHGARRRLPGGPIALRAGIDRSRSGNGVAELHSKLYGQHGGRARCKCLRNGIGPHGMHEWRLQFERHCRVSVWQCERLS
jgi:hypothetical protein